MTTAVPAPVSTGHECADGACSREIAPNVEVPSRSARILLRLLSLYQATSVIRRPRCRYIPTCSQYAVEAVSLHGAPRGSWLAVRRLTRCQPFGSFGFDPVPGSE